MKYWEEMNSKWGFNEGASVPPDAESCREVYIKALNGLLRKNESTCRIIPYNRPGVHNFIMILTVNIETYNNHLIHPEGYSIEEINEDEHFYKSVEEAFELDLDRYVVCEPKIDWESLSSDLVDLMTENCPV